MCGEESIFIYYTCMHMQAPVYLNHEFHGHSRCNGRDECLSNFLMCLESHLTQSVCSFISHIMCHLYFNINDKGHLVRLVRSKIKQTEICLGFPPLLSGIQRFEALNPVLAVL